MGYEFNIRLREADLEAIARSPTEIRSVPALLRAIPCYRGESEDGSCFFYSTDDSCADAWQSYVVVKEHCLEFCSYRSEDYQCITGFLFQQLMHLCGHFEIEDA